MVLLEAACEKGKVDLLTNRYAGERVETGIDSAKGWVTSRVGLWRSRA